MLVATLIGGLVGPSLQPALAAEVLASITIDGDPVTVTIPNAGDTARVTFEGTVGQNLGLGLTQFTIGSSNCCGAQVWVKKPDGSTLVWYFVGTNGKDFDLALPVSGTYSVVIDPEASNTGSATLTLSQDVVSTVAIGGSATSVTISRAGQNARVTFAGSAGQRLGLGVSGVTISSLEVPVLNPDGSTLVWNSGGTSGAESDFTLPAAGTYTVFLDPSGPLTGSATVTLSEDLMGSISIGGSSTSVSIPRIGQNARITFAGSAGQHLGLGASNNTFATSVTIRVFDPAGATVSTQGAGVSGSSGELDFDLPVTGTYTLFLDPYLMNTGSITLLLSEDVAGTISIGGAALSLATSRGGQNSRLTFQGSAGQHLGLGVSSVTYSIVTMRVYDPNGSFITSKASIASDEELDFDLPVDGTYTVFVDPHLLVTGSATFTLSEDVVAPIAIDAAPVGVTVSRLGENARLPFPGASGQTLALTLSNVTIAGSTCCSARVSILREDGSALTSPTTFGTNGATLFLPALDETGEFSIFVDPDRLKTGGLTATLYVVGDAPLPNAEAACGGVVRAEPVQGASQYQFQYATDSVFTNIVHDSGLVPTTNTYQPPAGVLANNATYYWRWKTATGSWSAAKLFQLKKPLLGARDYWPMWTQGALAVNQATGNLVLALPGPSYPTVAGSMGVSLAYNSLDTQNRGLGAGWALVAGDERADPPRILRNRHLLTGTAKLDTVEAVYADGSSTCFTHVGQTNSYQPEAGDGSQLSKNADGTWTLIDGEAIYSYGIADGSTGQATLTGVEYVDAAPGKGKLTYAYSAQDPAKLTSVTDEAGRALSLTWNSLNPSGCADAVVCISGPDAVTWRYKGDGSGGTSGKLARIHNGTRDLFALAYDASARVNKLQNANDLDPTAASPGYDGTHSVTVAYDGSGRVSSISDDPITGQTPTTSTWSFAYTPGSVSITATRAAHEGIAQGTVRTADGYTTVTPPRQQGEPSPKVIKTYYDNLAHPIEIVDQLGNITLAGYNGRDQLLWTEDEDGNPTDYSWDTVNDVLVSVTGPDPDGTGPLARPVSSNRYDEKAIGTSSTPGAALEGLQASYYDNPNLAGRPAARQTDTAVDFTWGSGGPSALTVTDNFSVRWTGNLIVGSAGAYTFSTVSDEGARLTIDGVQLINNWKDQTLTTVSSQPLTLTAGAHKLVLEYYEKTGPAEVHLRWSCSGCSPAIADQVVPSSALRPAWLNPTSSVSPLGKIAFSHYADPASGRADYALATLDDGTSVITSFSYDAWGRVTQKVMPKGNAGRTIDADGNLQGSPNLSYATSWAYYGLTETAAPPAACGGGSSVGQAGRPKSVTPNGIATTTSVYDNAGRPIAVTKGAGTTCRTYDAEGRLTSEKAPGDSQATTYTYDPAGARRSATDASGSITTDYDEAGRIKRSLDSLGAEATFAYDSEGNLVLRTAAAGLISTGPSYQTSYGYDAEGKLTSLTDPAGRSYSFFYDSRGTLKGSQYPNGTFSWNDYNQAGWLTALYNRHGTLSTPLPGAVPADASPISDYAYTYDLEGRKTQETRSGGGLTTETSSYVYDALGRLKTVNLPDGTARTYSFDLDSNRTAIVEDGQTVASYTYDPAQTPGVDQLTSVTEGGSTRTFTYDSDGNTTARGNNTLTWDGWGRHTGGTFNGTTISYGFDPIGFRRSRTAAGTLIRYLHGGLFETDTSGTVTLTDVDGPAGDLAHYSGPPTTGTAVSFVYYSGHGDVAAFADSSGSRTSAWTYDPFGRPNQTLAANKILERFTGRWDKKHDTTSNLIEMGARPYDPAVGRFLATDPVAGGSCNSYDYSCHDPINAYDLDGLWVSVAVRILAKLAPKAKHAAKWVATKTNHHLVRPVATKARAAASTISRVRVSLHKDPAHHRFPILGRVRHFQADFYIKGRRQSTFLQIRIPYWKR